MKSFKKLLEKRVRASHKIGADKYTIEESARRVLKSMFGQIGAEQINPQYQEKGLLKLACFRSSWRSEMFFFKSELVKKVNASLGRSVVKRVTIQKK